MEFEMKYISRSIRNTIAAFILSCPFPRDLLDRYEEGMTVTVQPIPGEPVEGKRNVYITNGHRCWPIVLNENNDGAKHNVYPLEICAKEIGMTGRNHKTGHTHWVAFDFDALVGHAKGVGVSDEQLALIREKVKNVDWVEL